MLFGFTGLAEYRSFKARRWILDTLGKSKTHEIHELFEEFRGNATEYFNSNKLLNTLPRAQKRLSVMFTGFVGSSLIGNCLITNYQDFDLGIDYPECFDDFRIQCLLSDTNEPTFVQRIGAWEAMIDSDEKDLRGMLIDKKPRKAVVDKAVSLIRKMADRQKSGGTIGKQINSICLEKGIETPISDYHTTVLKSESYTPDIIDLRTGTPNIQISDIKIESLGGPVSIPKVGRNHPCPCHSGEKYKYCHGK
jgi:hypothetical protein